MTVKLSIDNRIATVTLDRPEKMNALSEDMYLELTRVFGDLQTDDSVRAVLVTGSGKAFCSGSDVGGMHNVDMIGSRERMRRRHRMILNLVNLEKPVIAAVNGACVGIGFSIALACSGLMALLITGLVFLSPAQAQQPPYPSKPLKMIMPFPAGGPTDILGRLVGQKLTESFGQNVVIENRPGGGGVIGASLAVKSPPDGYTLYLGGITTLVLAPFVHKNLQYDPVRDFQPISQTTISPLLLMTHPSLPAKSVKDYIALARAKPGEINYASSGPGGSGHLAGELFRGITKVNIVHVPYRGAPPALTDLISGQVQSMFGTMLASVPHIRNGKLRALAVTGPQRSVAVPDVPTFAESGLPTYDASSWNGILVPAGTPRPIVDKLSAEIVKIMRTPGVLDRLANDGPIAIGSTPEQFAAYIKAEQAKWYPVVRAANIIIE